MGVVIGFVFGVMLTVCIMLSVGTTFEPREIELGQQMCVKNDGLKFVDREHPTRYVYTCKDGAKFNITDLGEVE